MQFLGFVGPALRLLNKGVGALADKSDQNPKTSAFLTVFGAIGGYLGIDPSKIADIGSFLVTAGTALQNLAGGGQ